MTHRRQIERRRDAGFTLLEILAITAILGILFRIGLPAFQGIRLAMALASAQQDISAMVLRARWMAINSGQSRILNCATASQVQITASNGSVLASLNLSQYFVTQAITAPGSTTAITFDTRGFVTAPATTPVTITITNPRIDIRTISVDLTGRVQNS